MLLFSLLLLLQHQLQTYSEVAVKGDLTDADIQRAADLLPVFEVKIIFRQISRVLIG